MLAIRTLAASAALLVLIAGAAVAQTPAPGAKATTPVTSPPVAATPAPTAPAPGTATTTAPAKKKAAVAKGNRSAESLACSAEADQKNIHGSKERKPFMAKCKADAKKAVKAGAAPPAPPKKS